MKEEKPIIKEESPEIIDITAEAEAKKAVKPYVEVKVRFKGEKKDLTIRGASLVQIHGKLAKLCEEKGVNYKNAFEKHEVIQ